MSELPKIVRARLGAQAAGGHPEADVLTAFCEQALPKNERGEVLAHLAKCAECRGVVALALPPVQETQVRVVREPASLWRWSLVRWGSLVACLVVVGAAVLIHPKPAATPVLRPSSEAEVVLPEHGVVKPPAEAQVGEPPASGLENLQAGSAEKDATSRTQTGKLMANALTHRTAIAASPVTKSLGTKETVGAQPESRTMDHTGAAAPPPAADAGPSNGRPSNGRSLSALAVPAPAPPARADVRLNADAGNENKMSEGANLKQVEVLEKSAEVPGRAKVPAQTNETEAPVEKGKVVLGLPGQRREDWAGSSIKLRTAIVRLSPEGQLQRSFDLGHTWEAAPVVERAKFSVVSMTGRDVWAGGAAGLLYHSADSGTHWTPVKPSVVGAALTADIVTLTFGDPQNGTLTTSDGQEWSTTDGGQTWQKKP